MRKKLLYFLILAIVFLGISPQVLAVDYIQGLQFVDNKIFESLKVKYYGTRITTDSANNFYVIGEMQDDDNGFTATIDADLNSGVSEKTGSFYMAKYSSQKELLWGYALGNNTNKVSSSGMGGIATDANNNVYITGTFRGTVDFDFSAATDSRTSAGQADIFLMKINSDGSYAWTKVWGNTADERYSNLAVDKVNGAVYVVGSLGSVSVDLNPGTGTDIESKSGLFISKFDLNGNYLWGNAYGLAASGNIFVEVKPTDGSVYFGTNYYNATIDFDPGAGIDNVTVGTAYADMSGFVSILTSANGYVDTYLLSKVKVWDIVFDSSGNLFLAGDFSGSLNLNPMGGVDTITSAGDADAFLSRWNADNSYAWTKRFGGSSKESGLALSVDTNNNVYLGGNMLSEENVDFDYSDGSDIHSNPAGQQSAFITIVRNDGSYVKTTSWGCDNVGIYGYGLTNIQDINVDSQGRVYAYGWNYGDTDFDPSSGVYTQKGYYNYASYISVFYPYISNDILVSPGTFGIAGESYSSDSSLLSLTSSSGSLSPTFNSTTYSYNISLGVNDESIAFTPTRNEANSRLTINNEVAFSGEQSKAMMVRPGSNTFTIKVTAADQTVSTYTITVNREKPMGDYYSYSSTKGIGNSGRLVEHNQSLIDASGNFYILGSYSGGSVDFGVSGDSDVSSSGQFLLKLDSNQNPLWVKRWVTSYDPELKDMDLDSSGNVYLAGEFSSASADFDPSENVVNPSIAGGSVLIKIEANGNFSFAKSWNSYYCSSVAVDSTKSSVYVGGYYYDNADFDPETSENNFLNPNGDDYPYFSKFNLSGAYSWTKTFTSASVGDYGDLEQMAVDSLGNIYVAGEFSAATMDFNPDPVATDLKTSYDATTTGGIFLTKINVDGSYAWTKVSTGDKYIGLDGKNSLLTTDSENNIILSGYFQGDATYNAYLNPDNLSQKFSSTLGSQDPFVQKYGSDGSLLWVKTFGGTDTESSMVVGVGPSDTVFVGGWYQNYGTKTTDFYPGVLEDTYQGDGTSGFLININKDGLYLGTSVLISTVSNQINSISFNGNEMYLGGSYSGTVDMNPISETTDAKSASGSGDIFLAKFTSGEGTTSSPSPTPTTTPASTPTPTPTPTTTPAVSGNVLINKISPLVEDSEEEWIELINTTTNRINLEDWTIEFSNPTRDTVTLSSLDILPKSGLLTINFSGDNVLSDDGGTITLKSPQGTVINTITYGAGAIPTSGLNSIIHRQSDGDENWEASSTTRKGWFIANSPVIETIDSDLGNEGIETNMAEETDLTRAASLYFERSGQGKIQFSSSLNLTDADVVGWLQSLNTKIDLSINGQIGLNTSEVQEAMSTQATLTMYNIYLNEPKILVDGADDNASVVSNLLYDRNAHTLTFNVAHFTTFKAVENSSSSTNSSGSTSGNGVSTHVCSDARPASAPDLFQIDVSSNTAKLFFTPIANSEGFYISFSTKALAEEHGAEVKLAREGVQNFTVNFLKANTVYYFKIRGQNGCATGEWSKVMKVITRPSGNKYTKSFYEYASGKTNFVGTKVIRSKNSLVTVTPEITPSVIQTNKETITPVITPSPKPSKKRCFLWWCF